VSKIYNIIQKHILKPQIIIPVLILEVILLLPFEVAWFLSFSGINISPVTLVFILVVSICYNIFAFDTLYTIVIGLFGLMPKKLERNEKGEMKVPKVNKYNKFVLIICAHNEQWVIGNTLEQMLKVKYPRNLLKVVVICDNCTDDTAKVAREIAQNEPDFITVLEREDKINKGKPFAVKYAFDWINENVPDYEAVSIADADNIYHIQFFEVMNWRLNQGAHILQGYLGIKNPYDSWVSTGSTLSYFASALVYFSARENLGMSSTVGGTGFVLSRYILEKVGWDMGSLTEDLEFSTKAILMGERINYAYDAITYDEKPTTLQASYHQRKRWMQGHNDVSNIYIWKLIKAFFDPKTKNRLSVLDYIIYLLRPIKKMWYGYFFTAVLLVIITNFIGLYRIELVPKEPIFVWGLLIAGILTDYIAALREGFRWWKIPHIIYYYTIFNLNDYLATFAGIFIKTPKGIWVKTEHKITVTAEQVMKA
jgi:cellulose synthase/poly-beta-1,6-N-acetylglucosamine synthase-like glycosyltransferase